MSRERKILKLPCIKVDSPTSLVYKKAPFIIVSVSFNDQAISRSRGLPHNKRYELHAQVVAEDTDDYGTRWNTTIGGWGARLALKESGRFNQKTLASLYPTNEQVMAVVQETLNRSGLMLDNKGSGLLCGYLSEHQAA